ncbi:hypothetical protein F5Y14DRAFT_68008 [Nemania sp. NC0429]|nr:hypothetical protein F5Y14DRAFT_68008 [Nemania sp. NC0429]
MRPRTELIYLLLGYLTVSSRYLMLRMAKEDWCTDPTLTALTVSKEAQYSKRRGEPRPWCRAIGCVGATPWRKRIKSQSVSVAVPVRARRSL